MDVEIWHNPRCTKSRQTLALLEARGIAPRIVEYLVDPPDTARIDAVIGLLGGDPMSLVRTKEAEWKALGLGEAPTRAEVADALAAHPRCIERPVVITPLGAAIGRPPERALTVLTP